MLYVQHLCTGTLRTASFRGAAALKADLKAAAAFTSAVCDLWALLVLLDFLRLPGSGDPLRDELGVVRSLPRLCKSDSAEGDADRGSAMAPSICASFGPSSPSRATCMRALTAVKSDFLPPAFLGLPSDGHEQYQALVMLLVLSEARNAGDAGNAGDDADAADGGEEVGDSLDFLCVGAVAGSIG